MNKSTFKRSYFFVYMIFISTFFINSLASNELPNVKENILNSTEETEIPLVGNEEYFTAENGKNNDIDPLKVTMVEIPNAVPFNDPAVDNPEKIASRHSNHVTPEEAEQLNKLYSVFKTILDSLVSNAQHLSQLIATGKLNPADRYGAFEWLQKFAMLAGKTTKLPYAPLTSNKLISFFTFNKMLVGALTMAFNNNFGLKPNIEQLEEALEDLKKELEITVRATLPLSLAENYAIESSHALQQITARISNGGLSWYNHFYRNILSIDRRFQLSNITKLALYSAVAFAAFLYILPPIKRGLNYGILMTAKEVVDGKEGSIIQNYGDHSQDEYKRLQLIFQAISAAGVLQQWGLFTKMQQTWSDIDSFLKGSTIDTSHQFIQFIDDFTLDDPMFDSVRHLFSPFEKILRFMADPDLYIRSGQKVPKCLLLTGAPGSGKSHSVLALAGSINQLLLEQGRPEKMAVIIVEPWDLAQFEEVVKRAKENAPCVIFIDEFHLFGGGAQITSNAMFLAKLLLELDAIEKNNDPMTQIFVIAATNRPDLIAKALLRHGRFGKDGQIRFPMPDFEQRKAVITTLSQKSAVDLSVDEINHLALITQGNSYSAISKMFEHAGFKAKERAEGITYSHLYDALNNVIRVLNERISLTDIEKDIIAYHLAGAALIHHFIKSTYKVDAITLKMPAPLITEGHEFLAKMENQDEDQQYKTEASYGAIYTYNLYECVMPDLYENEKDSLKIILGGCAAQKLVFGKLSSYRKDDRQKALENAQKLLLDGLKVADLSKKAQNTLKDTALDLINKAEAEVIELFKENRDKLDRIAHALKEKTFLTQKEVDDLIKEYPRPKPQ